MRRGPVVVVSFALCVLAAWAGWRSGRLPSETELIEFYAAQYVAEVGNGADVRDCVAHGGNRSEVWIRVECSPPDGPVWSRDVGRRGAIVPDPPPSI